MLNILLKNFINKILNPSIYNEGMSIILSIDCGTTSTRAIAFDESQNILHIEQKELSLQYPNPDWVEQSPDHIWQSTHECLDLLLSHIDLSSVHAIGITNQRETTIMWNKATGSAIGPAISWQCRRTADACAALSDHKQYIKATTGLPLDPYFSASKFQWLLNHYPEAQSLLHNDQLCFGTVDTWLLWNLTNGQSYATDVTNASRTMLYNIQTLSYDDTLCDLFQIPKATLPTVHPSAHHFGDYTHKNHTIPIHSMIGDQQSALFAQCSRSNNMIKNTYGTGLFLMANTGSTIVESSNLVSTIAIGIDQTVDYAIEGSVFTGGSLIQWLRDDIGLIANASESEPLAQSVNDTGGVIIPALTGLGAPHWKPDATGLITGLTRSTTKAHIMRAALFAIAFQSNDIIECLQRECPNLHLNVMRVDGGQQIMPG